MIHYADEQFYEENYLLGRKAVINTAFPYFSKLASQEIKRFTGSNIDEDNIPECVKMCCCEVAETIYKSEETANEHRGVSSESVGGWSRSYEGTDETMQVMQKNIKSIVYKWLSGTGLLFRGVYNDEKR